MIAAGALVVLPAKPAVAASLSCADGSVRFEVVRVFPGQDLDLDLSKAAAFVLLEELGADIEYRWRAEAEFVDMATPPPRLGFAVLPRRSSSLTLRVKAGQGTGQVRVSCLSAVDSMFFSMLADLRNRHLTGSAAAVTPALPLIAELAAHDPDPVQLAWLENARANALLIGGEGEASIDAFRRTRNLWFAIDRPDRAAIALMAAGEGASRAGRFDDARAWLSLARDELSDADIQYYALRSQAALCTILSRQARYRESMECERAVVSHMHAQGEHAEAAARHVSIGNQHLRFYEHEAAREQYLQADQYRAQLTPIVQSRLGTAFGTYFLLTGDVPAAAQELALASQRLGDHGLPAEQANVDMKLARLARMAGADLERKRLLERAVAQIGGRSAPALRAEAQVLLARTLIELGEPDNALALSQAAHEACRALDKLDCIESSQLAEIHALIELGNTSAARSRLDALPPGSTQSARADLATLSALLELAEGHPHRADAHLPGILAIEGDPDVQARYAAIKAAILIAGGDTAEATDLLEATLHDQVRSVRSWPSIALRISARNRLADLQAQLFDALLTPATRDDVDRRIIERIVRAIEVVGPHDLLHATAAASLPDGVRKALSAFLTETGDAGQRELFLALARTEDGTDSLAAGAPSRVQTTADTADQQFVILPLAGKSRFTLLTWRSGIVRTCRQMQTTEYTAQASDFQRALDGEEVDLVSIDLLAREWHRAIRQCDADAPAAAHWRIISTPRTPSLPWAWIAASGEGVEPSVSTVFGFPGEAAPNIDVDAPLTLVDLDMPNVASLPFATRERDAIRAAGRERRIHHEVVVAADHSPRALLDVLASGPLLHIIGHANPAAYGQLYQGLWFESAGKPSLLTYPEIAATPSRARLVVLSACGTGSARSKEFGASSLLAEAFIAAGAAHVVAASNALSDTAAPLWARTFHEYLRESGDVSGAARQARSVLRASPHFRHPKFWAGIEVYAAVRTGSSEPG